MTDSIKKIFLYIMQWYFLLFFGVLAMWETVLFSGIHITFSSFSVRLACTAVVCTRIADKCKYLLSTYPSKLQNIALGIDLAFMGTSLFSQNLKKGISVQLTMLSTLLNFCQALMCVEGILQCLKMNKI